MAISALFCFFYLPNQPNKVVAERYASNFRPIHKQISCCKNKKTWAYRRKVSLYRVH